MHRDAAVLPDLGRNHHRAARRRLVDGARQQVEHGLFQRTAIRGDIGQVLGNGVAHDHPRPAGLLANAQHAALEQGGNGNARQFGLIATIAQPRKIIELIHQRCNVLPGLPDILGIGFIALISQGAKSLRAHQVGKADNGVERLADAPADPGKQRRVHLRWAGNPGSIGTQRSHQGEIARHHAGLALAEHDQFRLARGRASEQIGALGLGKAGRPFQEIAQGGHIFGRHETQQRLALDQSGHFQQRCGARRYRADHAGARGLDKAVAAQLRQGLGKRLDRLLMAGAHFGGARRQHQRRAPLP